jgi:hypothetical protein
MKALRFGLLLAVLFTACSTTTIRRASEPKSDAELAREAETRRKESLPEKMAGQGPCPDGTGRVNGVCVKQPSRAR